jgi:hypothetical protein
VKEIPLTKGKVAIVDDEDYEKLSKYKWHAMNGKYAARSVWNGETKKKTMILMHREICGNPEGLDVDHIDMNTFDNRKQNLRAVTHQHNCFNRPGMEGHSKYKGVNKIWNGTWAARISVGGKGINLGTYQTEEDAAKAYNVGAVQIIGETAMLNEVDYDGFTLNIRKPSSKYRGVSKDVDTGKWNVHVNVNKKKTFLGLFEDEHDAARMYNFWAVDVYGNKARLNVINEEETK